MQDPYGVPIPFAPNTNLIPHLTAPDAKRNYLMTIHYEDVAHNPHASLKHIGKDRTKLLKHT
jgi:hypothetical protein